MGATGVVLLAAGASVRLGSPKQNLNFQGQTLMQHAVQVAQQSGSSPIVVVLGAQADSLRAQLNFPEMYIVENKEWKEGMSASIRHGLAALLKVAPLVENVIIMLCDQPFVSGELLQELIKHKETSSQKIIACSYQDTVGTPVLFDKQYFQELLALHGNNGAKKLLYQYPEFVATIPFELGSFDIDTVSDYTALQQYLSGNSKNPATLLEDNPE
ncbi:nucleotidyltransferase family protein [Adhaeribacter radiodurans]|uniref:Nucleotidyltransferase family protein n=1 Tax=Adhaeribacter radiodurans TaxID=2745197 RepID=A0A7L7L9T0_9BACT|nr:nucleotidyltransferase family protein [Adhaeribacter radiodurans]QMU29606.1 nucleotidyltransferase family protein [Adhaeribacter radiodurans]